MSLDEFQIISTYFIKNKKRSDVLVGIGDDCAFVNPPQHKNLLITTDTLNVGSHFFPDTSPFDIGYKAVAVSLSDLAAKGGEPAWLLLALTLPVSDDVWLEKFATGLFSCSSSFNVELIGGNTARGPLSVTTQLIGFVEKNLFVTRSSSKVGDLIFVTGNLGDPRLALALLNGEIDAELFTEETINLLTKRLFQPLPRINEGQIISRFANAAIDISDGLLADLQHILDQSQVGAILELQNIPISKYLEKIADEKKWDFALNGGDDYELCFTIPPHKVEQLKKTFPTTCRLTCIGEIVTDLGLKLIQPDDRNLPIEKKGYKHF